MRGLFSTWHSSRSPLKTFVCAEFGMAAAIVGAAGLAVGLIAGSGGSSRDICARTSLAMWYGLPSFLLSYCCPLRYLKSGLTKNVARCAGCF